MSERETTFTVDYDAFCFVCGRCTDHFAEHDALVEAGLAEYDGLNVYRTDKWDDETAAAICEAEYQAYRAELGLSYDPESAS